MRCSCAATASALGAWFSRQQELMAYSAANTPGCFMPMRSVP